jgi:hypothetical protein
VLDSGINLIDTEHRVYGDWIVFSANRKDLLRIAAKDVKSVRQGDVPDAQYPSPVVA